MSKAEVGIGCRSNKDENKYLLLDLYCHSISFVVLLAVVFTVAQLAFAAHDQGFGHKAVGIALAANQNCSKGG